MLGTANTVEVDFVKSGNETKSTNLIVSPGFNLWSGHTNVVVDIPLVIPVIIGVCVNNGLFLDTYPSAPGNPDDPLGGLKPPSGIEPGITNEHQKHYK